MDHSKILSEVEDLLNIPEFKEILVHRIEELKLLLGKDIEHYRNITRIIKPGKKAAPSEGIQFELMRVRTFLWIPSLPGRPDCDAYKFIPRVIIDYIVDFDIEPGAIKMISGLKFPGLKGRVFNLSFEKHGEDFISGIIAEKRVEKEKKETDTDYRRPMESVDFSDMEILFIYMLNHPFIYDHVIKEFKLVWKPLIDSDSDRNVQCRSSS